MVFMLVLSLLYPASATFYQRPSAPRSPATAELSRVADDLKRLVAANPGTAVADKIEDSLAKVETAIDKLGMAPADMQGALGDLEGAAGDIEAALASRLLPARVAANHMERIARAARQVAVRAIADAVTRRADSTKVAEARRVLGAGDGERNTSRYKNAVAHYKDAVAKAQGA